MKISDHEKNVKLRRSPWFWPPLVALILFGAYAIAAYWVPYFQWKELMATDYVECANGDNACMDRNLKEWKKTLKLKAPLFRVSQSWEFAGALRHPDGTSCFLITDPNLKAPDTVLTAWLDNFGLERFVRLAPFFLRMRELFEKRYHMPSPAGAMIDVASELKWDYPFMGRTWRDYNTAELFWRWTPILPSPKLPNQMEAEIFYHYIKNGYLFQNQNLFRLIELANIRYREDLAKGM